MSTLPHVPLPQLGGQGSSEPKKVFKQRREQKSGALSIRTEGQESRTMCQQNELNERRSSGILIVARLENAVQPRLLHFCTSKARPDCSATYFTSAEAAILFFCVGPAKPTPTQRTCKSHFQTRLRCLWSSDSSVHRNSKPAKYCQFSTAFLHSAPTHTHGHMMAKSVLTPTHV